MSAVRFVAGVVLGLACGVWAADTHEPVKRGAWKVFTYDKPTTDPIVFSGWSKAQEAAAADYCMWLDIHYDNGEAAWGRKAVFRQGTHDWEPAHGVFVPRRPVVKIEAFALFRALKGDKTRGHVEFRDFTLERREGHGENFPLATFTDRPFSNNDVVETEIFTGRKTRREMVARPRADAPTSPVPSGEVVVWTADAMRLITPLTFPTAADARTASLSLAKRERESVQVLLSTAADVEWLAATLELPVLKRADGLVLQGAVDWRRQGYLAREYGAHPHPHAFPHQERWFPDPLLPPAPMRVRKAATQGTWITVYAAPEAEAGVYMGDIVVKEAGVAKARVPLTVRVEPFALPATFGLETAYSVMDGFTKALYPNDFAAKRRETWDIMLDHRLNPDDISRTSPPDIQDLLHARERGMNRFNILNVVPPPKNPKARWVLVAKPEEIFNDDFYSYFIGVVKPYVAELKRHGLDKFAYVYGFDERQKEFYAGIEDFWHKLQRDVPGIPLMATAKNYKDYAEGHTEIPHLLSGDWYCPTTSTYRKDISDKLRAEGKKVWWYVCCSPAYPYANFASWEYPPIEGRLLGWMTWRWRADGFLFWIVNKWHGDHHFKDDDTYFPDYRTYNGNGMPGDGIMMYPGEKSVWPSIKLAQCRDAEEDYEYLKLAAAKKGNAVADAACDAFIRSLTDYSRDPAELRAQRARLAALLAE